MRLRLAKYAVPADAAVQTASPVSAPALLLPTLLARRPSKTLGHLPALIDYLREDQPAALLSATLHLNIEAVLAK